jgi:hypothetical protein
MELVSLSIVLRCLGHSLSLLPSGYLCEIAESLVGLGCVDFDLVPKSTEVYSWVLRV